MFSFPKFIIPAELIFSITVASYGEIKFSNILEPHVVLIPFVHMLSFIPIGIPANSEVISPLSIFLSISSACFIASSVRTVKKAFKLSSFSLTLSANALVISAELNSFF